MSVKIVAAETVQKWLKEGARIAVVDVRDEDFIGGHVRGCWRYPLRSFSETAQDLSKRLSDGLYDKVIFHCALSQVRGPKAARQFALWCEPSAQVHVMSGGFTRWAQLYGSDKEVTEDYRPDLWE